jgi:acetyl-CoA acetyltransferase family protein
MAVASAVIVDVVRTPLGRRNGRLRGWHPVDLAACTLEALQARNDLDPALVDDVVMGCVTHVGEQSQNVGRCAVLAAGWPESVPGTTVDRQCGSSQQAAQFAAMGVLSGVQDVVVAAGVESMTRVPMGSSFAGGRQGHPFGPAMSERYAEAGGLIPQGPAAELVAARWGITREEVDRYAVRSYERAAKATADGRFADEIVPVYDHRGELMTSDEGLRDTTYERIANLKPAFEPGGVVTAANASQISDGAAAALIMSEARAAALGLRPRARFVGFAVAGDDPRLMLTAPIEATRKVLARTGLALDDMDLVEVNEAFATVVLAWARELHPDLEKVNVNGGAIALGHPLGASGGRILATLVNELERTGGRYGLQTMCEAGGMANATIIERL